MKSKADRGIGEGKDYIPYTKTYEFASKGRVSRLQGIKTNRIHHLQSDIVLRAFLVFEWSDDVVDIRESYPLRDVLEVIDDKADLRFDRFQNEKTKEQYVLTTSFLLTTEDANGLRKEVARTIKSASDLERATAWENLEIQRRYWKAKNVDWKVLTEKEIPRQLAKNIEWVRETLLNTDQVTDRDGLSEEMLSYLFDYPDMPVEMTIKRFESKTGIKSGIGLYLFRYLLAKKAIRIDLQKTVSLKLPLHELLLDET